MESREEPRPLKGVTEPTGTLAFITAEVVLGALRSVKSGQVVPLGLPLDRFDPGPFGRPPARRRARQSNELVPLADGRYGLLNDDILEIALQGSSHWDSLAHFGLIDKSDRGIFHGGAGLEETTPGATAHRLGVDAYRGGIVTRGVLIDAVGALCSPGEGHLPDSTRLCVDDINRCLRDQGTTLQRGDGVLVFTGFEHRLAGLSAAERLLLEETNAGLDSSTMPFWVEHEVSFLASDNYAVEAIPIDYGIHAGALRDCGMPLGELWALDALAQNCRSDRRFEFLVVAVPLIMPGAFGSPANALAIR